MTIRSLKKEQSMTMLLLSLLLLLGGCKSTTSSGDAFVGVDFINRTGMVLRDVKLAVIEDMAHVSCTHIDSSGQCGTGFPAHSYNAEQLRLSYYQGKDFKSHVFNIKVPEEGAQLYRVQIRVTATTPDVSVIKQ
ncbi:MULTISPECIES: hypothetical protein [unclassified Pseudoalteromonas]|uniref:hypothetical protein n=1 Tax=unclassified Pseudoalteromonas TaxID=194690 RepID=UPI000CF6CC1B|nr:MULTISPECIES: hypothetical protein [unclassified Pseudoalteromonas]MBS3796811.1 hypothetical protein [Pseudoalteromonas sp. BDTF-M6]